SAYPSIRLSVYPPIRLSAPGQTRDLVQHRLQLRRIRQSPLSDRRLAPALSSELCQRLPEHLPAVELGRHRTRNEDLRLLARQPENRRATPLGNRGCQCAK